MGVYIQFQFPITAPTFTEASVHPYGCSFALSLNLKFYEIIHVKNIRLSGGLNLGLLHGVLMHYQLSYRDNHLPHVVHVEDGCPGSFAGNASIRHAEIRGSIPRWA